MTFSGLKINKDTNRPEKVFKQKWEYIGDFYRYYDP